MYAVDFEYDGHRLSDYGCIICEFDYSGGVVTSSAGSTITFTKASRNSGRSYGLTGTRYDECMTATFDIAKDTCDGQDAVFTSADYRDLIRWLNRKEFLKFQFIDNEEYDYRDTCYYNVSFNIEKIKVDDLVYGLRLTIESDSPFGYGDERRVSLNFTQGTLTKKFLDMSDEIGFITPSMEITIASSGDLTLTNSLTDTTMVIYGCTQGEVITIDGDIQSISTSLASHDIPNNFNFEFLKIGNSFDDRQNVITSSLSCKILLTYTPVVKDSP